MNRFATFVILAGAACHLAGAACQLAGAACQLASAEEPDAFSGPQPGEPLPELKVLSAFESSAAAKPYDLVKRTKDKPLLLVVIHDMLANRSDEPSLGLSYVLTHYAASRQNSGLKRAVLFLTDDQTEMTKFLTKVRRALPKKETPILISTDGLEGPGAWGFNRNLRMTVIIAKEGRAVANFALQQPSVGVDTTRILGELVKVIGGDVPKLADLDFPYYIGKPPAED